MWRSNGNSLDKAAVHVSLLAVKSFGGLEEDGGEVEDLDEAAGDTLDLEVVDNEAKVLGDVRDS